MSSDGAVLEARARLHRVNVLERQGITPYPHAFERTHTLAAIHAIYGSVGREGTAVNLSLCGCVMNIQLAANRLLIDVEDRDGKLRFLLRAGGFADRVLNKFMSLVFRGDTIGFRGTWVFTDETGELTVEVNAWNILAPSLLPLPHHIENPVEQHFLHLAIDIQARQRFITQRKVVRYIRRFLEDNYQCIEVKTPTRHLVHDDSDGHLYGTGTYLKQLLLGGMEAVFEISDASAGSNITRQPSSSDQVLQCYLSPRDLGDMMTITEQLIRGLARELEAGDAAMLSDLKPPWPRRSVFAIAQETTGVDFLRLSSIDEAIDIALSAGVTLTDQYRFNSIGAIVICVIEQKVFPTFVRPTFVVDFPVEEAPLTKPHRHDRRLAERCDLLIKGLVVASIHMELNDPREGERQCADKTYVNALKYGLPPTVGLRLNIDQLVLLLTDVTDSGL